MGEMTLSRECCDAFISGSVVEYLPLPTEAGEASGKLELRFYPEVGHLILDLNT